MDAPNFFAFILFGLLFFRTWADQVNREATLKKKRLRLGRRYGHIQKLHREIEPPDKPKTGEQRNFTF
jgi:hypothetical protein